VHGRRREFFQGEPLVDFSKSFSRGAKAGEICFLPLEPKKIAFFAEIIKFLPPSPQPEGNIRVIAPHEIFKNVCIV